MSTKFWEEPELELRRLQESLAMGAPMPLRFWESPQALHNIRDLIVYLDAQDDGELERKDLLYLLKKPWKWEPEYKAMRAGEDK